ncbi:MAG: MltA domain-containing protein [Roseibium sp.]|uniref:murein transglycosylase A n=1 Tax=Roseibium sp. TaxID=1936156 RepID=UPI003D9C040E
MATPQSPKVPDHFEKIDFSELAGWENDEQHTALVAFGRFCGKTTAFGSSGLPGYDPANLNALCAVIAGPYITTPAGAQRFFETRFTAYRITEPGFVTGYFEPEVTASRIRTDRFSVPLHRKPDGLEAITPENRPVEWLPELSHGRRTDKGFSQMPDRAGIMSGALDTENLELVWLADPIDAYFIHVQGSARLRLTDGSVMRVGYAGKSGHPYTGIGKLLVERGEGAPEDFTMQGLRSWLSENPQKRDALFGENRSYIFFREVLEAGPEDGPVGAAGLPLIAGRSLAIDPAHLPYGAFVFVEAGFQDPDREGRTFARLMIADDTGSAIRGRARGDIFVGAGDRAGELAGDIRHRASFTVLVPKPMRTGTDAATD